MNMKKIICFFILMLLPVGASAFIGEVVIEGIKYHLISKGRVAEVRANNYFGDVVIPSSVEYDGVEYHVEAIGEGAFRECLDLTSVSIPNSVTAIGREAFRGCRNLHRIPIPNSVRTIGSSAFKSCSSLLEVIIPPRLTTIEGEVFAACKSLQSVAIPENVRAIEMLAFNGCTALTSVVIGKNVTKIAGLAFNRCSELTDIYLYPEEVPEITEYTFANADLNFVKLHVPDASIDKYKASLFGVSKTIVGLSESPKCATPTISYSDGRLHFGCSTEGVTYRSFIFDDEVTAHEGNEIELTRTYKVEVYATKVGFLDSDKAAVTLKWPE